MCKLRDRGVTELVTESGRKRNVDIQPCAAELRLRSPRARRRVPVPPPRLPHQTTAQPSTYCCFFFNPIYPERSKKLLPRENNSFIGIAGPRGKSGWTKSKRSGQRSAAADGGVAGTPRLSSWGQIHQSQSLHYHLVFKETLRCPKGVLYVLA